MTKHPGTGGLVSVDTVTAQLLYEIQGLGVRQPRRGGGLRHHPGGRRRAPTGCGCRGCAGRPAPATTKVAINYLGGYRNSMTFVLTGLDIEAKADLAERTLWSLIPGRPRRLRRGRRAPAPHRPRRSGHQRGRPGRAARSRSWTATEAKVGPGLLEHGHRDGAGQLPGAVHHLAAGRRLELRRLLAGAGPGRRPRPRGGARRRAHPSSSRSTRRRAPSPTTTTTRDVRYRLVPPSTPEPARRPRRRRATPTPIALGPPGRRPLGRQGRQRQHRGVGPRRRRLRLAAPVPDRRAPAPAHAGRDRGSGGRAATSCPTCGPLNFVIVGLLGRGVAASTRLDPQAKGLGEYLRAKVVEVPSRPGSTAARRPARRAARPTLPPPPT